MSNNPFAFPYQMASNPFPANNQLLPNPFGNTQPALQTLNLTQFDNFNMVEKFKDDTNVEWALVKKSSDSTVDIPDPKSIQILSFWNHIFPGAKNKVYLYVVEGIRQPRVETEKPTLVLYQWFSSVFVPNFTPQMITPAEWLKANVYAAPILDARISKLYALCNINQDSAPQEENNDQLLKADEFINEQHQ